MNEQHRHNTLHHDGQVDTLDRLFARGRNTQPQFSDDNFTKRVLNSLPANPHRIRNKQYYPDIVGLLVGLLATYMLVDPVQLMAGIFTLFPDTVSISLKNMLFVSVAFSVLALLGWYGVEHKLEEN